MTVKSSLLEMLEKNKGEVLSGESIAGELGCTRAAVWKAVKSLREEGYHIEAGPNKGYMLAKEPKDYTVGMLLRTTEGDLAPVSCVGNGAVECDRADGCAKRAVF